MDSRSRSDADETGLYADPNGGITPILRWPEEEWRQFRRRFQREVAGFFQDRIWLVPPAGYAGLDWPDARRTHRPNVKCGLTVWLHDWPEHARIALDCIYPVPGTFFRSGVDPATRSGEWMSPTSSPT